MKLIALSGWKRSGKDSVADCLVAEYGAVRIGFADPLKDVVAREFGLTREFIDDPVTKEAPLLHMPVQPKDAYTRMVTEFLMREFRDQNGMRMGEGSPESIMHWTPRALCILIGSTLRCANPNYWVDQALKKMTADKMYVISDVRYQSEMAALKAAIKNLATIRINRFETTLSHDPSERDLDDYSFDYVIHNKGTLDDLYRQVRYFGL